MAGDVRVNGTVASKSGQLVYISEKIEIVDQSKEYVLLDVIEEFFDRTPYLLLLRPE